MRADVMLGSCTVSAAAAFSWPKLENRVVEVAAGSSGSGVQCISRRRLVHCSADELASVEVTETYVHTLATPHTISQRHLGTQSRHTGASVKNR
jgi:hypothetical protein